MNDSALSRWLSGVGQQLGGIVQEGIGVFAEGGINRLRDDPPRPVDETPVPSDAQGADGSISFSPLTYASSLPLSVKIAGGALVAFLIYKAVK